MNYLKSYDDKKFFNWRERKARIIKPNNVNLYIAYGGRNLGKTTNIYRSEFQDMISLYKNKQVEKIKPVGIIIRSESAWKRVKQSFLSNLKHPPFNIDFELIGTKLWYIERFIKKNKDGSTTPKFNTCFVLGEILFLWSAVHYKNASLEHLSCLIYDEMIPEVEGYIPNEIEKFESLITTFSRLGTNKYIVGIGNKITDTCPYFDYIGLDANSFPKVKTIAYNEKNRTMIENCFTNEYVEEKIKSASANSLLINSDYSKMFTNDILKVDSYMLLFKAKGYVDKYNFWIEGESYKICENNYFQFWIKKGKNEQVANYYGDLFSATKNLEPKRYTNPEWFANLLATRINKGDVKFKDFDTREVFVFWLKNKYREY